jgi:hypothetical protein
MNTAKANERTFSIDFVTADRRRGTAGRLKQMTNMVTCGAHHDEMEHNTITIQDADGKSHPIPVHTRLIMKVNQEKVL